MTMTELLLAITGVLIVTLLVGGLLLLSAYVDRSQDRWADERERLRVEQIQREAEAELRRLSRRAMRRLLDEARRAQWQQFQRRDEP